MTIPSRLKQIERVAEFLEDPSNDERSVKDVAKIIVDGMYEMWTRGVEDAPVPLRVGLAFRTPMVAKTRYVAWIGRGYWGKKWSGQDLAWVVDADSTVGTLATLDNPLWRVVTEVPDYRKKKDKPRAGEPGYNVDGWQKGDKVSQLYGMYRYEVIATGDKCVLLRREGSAIIQADSNANLKKYYQEEIW